MPSVKAVLAAALNSSHDKHGAHAKNHVRSNKRQQEEQPSEENFKLQRQERQEEKEAKEMQEFTRARDQFQSNLFYLQMHEMLEESKAASSHATSVDEEFSKLKKLLSRVPAVEGKTFTEAKLLLKKHNVCMPLVHTDDSCQYKFSFEPPTEVVMLTHHASSNTEPIDIAVRMPSSLFQRKDYMNFRYFHKRAFYLSMLAVYLKKSDQVNDITFSCLHGDAYKPILSLSLNGTLFHLVPCVDVDTFEGTRLASHRCNLRQFATAYLQQCGLDHISDDEKEQEQDEADNDNVRDKVTPDGPRTPHYNALILEDMYLVAHHQFLSDAILQYPNLREAIDLIRRWCDCRQMTRRQRAMSAYEFSLFFAFLATQQHSVSPAMSSIQVLRIAWQSIVDGHLIGDCHPVRFRSRYCRESDAVAPRDAIPCADPLVFFHGDLNVTHSVTAGQAQRLREEAREALLCLRLNEDPENQENIFPRLFVHRFNPYAVYDAVLSLHITQPLPSVHDTAQMGDMMMHFAHLSPVQDREDGCASLREMSWLLQWMDASSDVIQWIQQRALDVLQRALGHRARLMVSHRIDSHDSPHWSLHESLSNACQQQEEKHSFQCLLGLSWQSETAFQWVEHGPSPEQTAEARAFRDWWGERAELRRFRDGRIVESVVWSSTECDRESLPVAMAEYLVRRHVMGDGQWLQWYRAPSPSHRRSVDGRPPIAVTAVFQQLSQELKLLGDKADGNAEEDDIDRRALPLAITTAQLSQFPIESLFLDDDEDDQEVIQIRWASTKVAVMRRYARQPVPVVIAFESSTRWPEDSVAIAKLKQALLVRVARQLQHHYGYVCVVSSEGFMDVLKDSVLFRLSIRQEEASSGAASVLTSQLLGLAARTPSMSTVLSLVRRWCRAHFLTDDQLPDVLVVLVVASLFVKGGASVPQSSVSGFLQTLERIVSFDWQAMPFVVSFDLEEEREEEFKRLGVEKASLSAFLKAQPRKGRALQIITSSTEGWQAWESVANAVTTAMLRRWIKYAGSTLAAYRQWAMRCPAATDDQLSWASLWVTPLHVYDAVLRVRREDGRGGARVCLLGFDAMACYVRDLRACYGNEMVFLHDERSMVAVVFKPAFRQPVQIDKAHPLLVYVRQPETILAEKTRRQAKKVMRAAQQGEPLVWFSVKELVLAHIRALGHQFVLSMGTTDDA